MWSGGSFDVKEADVVLAVHLDEHKRARSQQAIEFATITEVPSSTVEEDCDTLAFSSSSTHLPSALAAVHPGTPEGVPLLPSAEASDDAVTMRMKKLDELLRVDQPPQVKAGKILNLFMQYARENARLHAEVETLRAHSHVVQATRLTRRQAANAFSQQDMQTGEVSRSLKILDT